MKASVRAALEKLLSALPENQLANLTAALETQSVDWAAKVAAWIAHKTALKLKPKTLKDYRWNLDRWLVKFGDLPRSAITAEAVEEHSHTFGWGVNQRRHYIRTATGFLAWCGLALKVPCPGHQSAGAEAVISEELHKRALAIAPSDVGPILAFMWHTGCRPCEACNLTAESVDWQNGTVKLREHKTSGKGKQRMLYLSAPALAILTGQKQKHGATGPLFRTKFGTAYLRTGLSATMVLMGKKLGARITAYGYRHTYATRALELGLPDVQVAALLGHSSTKMVHSHYSHLDQNAKLLKAAAAKIG